MRMRTAWRIAERAIRAVRPDFGQPLWRQAIRTSIRLWNEVRGRARSGRKILIATSVGGHVPSTTVESLLAVALSLRGAEVQILLCDEFLPACLRSHIVAFSSAREFVEKGPQGAICWDCYRPASLMFGSLGLKIFRFSELVCANERMEAGQISEALPLDRIADFRVDGLSVGEHAMAGALRFFARGTLDDEPTGERVLRRYLQASLLSVYALRRLMREQTYDCLVLNHGIYVPHGLIAEVARERKARVVTWNPAYRKKCFIFSHDDSYHHTMLSEPTATWENLSWTERLETDLMTYLKSRWEGSRDWIKFHRDPEFEVRNIEKQLALDFSTPTIGMLTNVMWDAQLHYRSNAFKNMLEWVLETIHYFSARSDLQLLIRVHPAEVRGAVPSRQPIVKEIMKAFPILPSNVFIIPPESNISTYAAMLQCNAVIIYGTKTGVELSSMGIPIIVAGEAWIRNKGITLDASSKAEYHALLSSLPLSAAMDKSRVRRARMYAHHFFFRRMIPIECIHPAGGYKAFWSPYTVVTGELESLLPGKDPGLDIICEGICAGTEFVYRVEPRLQGE